MNKAGGIAYLLKHGRAPMPTVTRTKMPRGKGYAEGGLPVNEPINNSLGYGPEYDYQFVPGGMELDASGKPVYRSGKFVRKTQPPAAAAATAAQDPYARSSSSYGAGKTDPETGKPYGWTPFDDMTMAEKATHYANNPREAKVAGALRGLFDNSLLGMGLGWLADKINPEGAQERRQSGMVYDAFNNTYGSDRYGLSPDRFGYGAGGGGGFAPISIGGDAVDAVGSGEKAAQDYYNANREQFQSTQPTITQAMRDAAIREGGGTPTPSDGGGSAGPLSGSSWGPYSGSLSSDSYSGYTTGSNTDSGGEGAAGGFAQNGRIRHMAAGGIGSLPAHGGFVGSYAKGGRMLRGPGDGLSDHIPAVIGKGKPARLADGEFVVSADVVSTLGGGSTEAGAKKLYAMMDRIRKAGHGTKKQVKPVKEHKVLPA